MNKQEHFKKIIAVRAEWEKDAESFENGFWAGAYFGSRPFFEPGDKIIYNAGIMGHYKYDRHVYTFVKYSGGDIGYGHYLQVLEMLDAGFTAHSLEARFFSKFDATCETEGNYIVATAEECKFNSTIWNDIRIVAPDGVAGLTAGKEYSVDIEYLNHYRITGDDRKVVILAKDW